MIESQIELEKAIARDRNNERAINQLGITLIFLGRPEAALPHLEKAFLLNQRAQNVFYNFVWLGYCHILMNHADEAIDFLRKGRTANPRLSYTHLFLAAALGMRGDIDEARAALAEAIKLEPEFYSIARLRAVPNYSTMDDPRFVALREKTLEVGLRCAGLPDE